MRRVRDYVVASGERAGLVDASRSSAFGCVEKGIYWVAVGPNYNRKNRFRIRNNVLKIYTQELLQGALLLDM